MANDRSTGAQVSGTSVPLQKAGDIDIQALVLENGSGARVDVTMYAGELNLFEDMFAPGLYGNLLMLDSDNLSSKFGLSGDEWFTIKIRTPTMPDSAIIHKKFKVYSITDRTMISDTGKQSYLLHFCSPELWVDNYKPLYKTYTGGAGQLVRQIFNDNLRMTRTGQSNQFTELTTIGETQNQIKFTSPGWTPVEAINWLASRSLGVGLKSPGYVFYESNKSFYFANVEAIIDRAINTQNIYQTYNYVAKNTNANAASEPYGKDINEEYTKATDLQVKQSFNSLRNLQNGYYGNKLFTLDLQTKEYNAGFAYDHVTRYSDYRHLENIRGNRDCAPFANKVLYSADANLSFYPKHKNLYTGFTNNSNDIIEQIIPARTSALNELHNFTIMITVPGRTDIEVGNIIKFNYPDASPRDESDKSKSKEDKLYSGYYLVTAIRHKIFLGSHAMMLEISKDSLRRRPGTAENE